MSVIFSQPVLPVDGDIVTGRGFPRRPAPKVNISSTGVWTASSPRPRAGADLLTSAPTVGRTRRLASVSMLSVTSRRGTAAAAAWPLDVTAVGLADDLSLVPATRTWQRHFHLKGKIKG